jgi:hypothetical protein
VAWAQVRAARRHRRAHWLHPSRAIRSLPPRGAGSASECSPPPCSPACPRGLAAERGVPRATDHPGQAGRQRQSLGGGAPQAPPPPPPPPLPLAVVLAPQGQRANQLLATLPLSRAQKRSAPGGSARCRGRSRCVDLRTARTAPPRAQMRQGPHRGADWRPAGPFDRCQLKKSVSHQRTEDPRSFSHRPSEGGGEGDGREKDDFSRLFFERTHGVTHLPPSCSAGAGTRGRRHRRRSGTCRRSSRIGLFRKTRLASPKCHAPRRASGHRSQGDNGAGVQKG